MHGLTSAIGESTILGLLKGFPSRLVGAFASGTGFAGVVGAGIFIILKPFMEDGYIFLIATPLVVLYFINIVILVRRKSKYPFVDETPEAEERARSIRESMEHSHPEDSKINDKENGSSATQEELEGIAVGDDSSSNVPFTLENAKIVVKKVGW